MLDSFSKGVLEEGFWRVVENVELVANDVEIAGDMEAPKVLTTATCYATEVGKAACEARLRDLQTPASTRELELASDRYVTCPRLENGW